MSADIFISTNNTEPYDIVDFDRIADNIIVDATEDANSVEFEDMLYLIITDNVYNRLDVKVENENSSGASLYISPVDGIGFPTHWGKVITINNIDARAEHIKIPFKYKWTVINNIYIIKRQHVAGHVNVYNI
jgi:hypothetical protein